jgi:hypothetical protein
MLSAIFPETIICLLLEKAILIEFSKGIFSINFSFVHI